MSNKTSLKKSSVSVVISILVSLCFVQSANAAGWGKNDFGQANPPPEIDFVDIAANWLIDCDQTPGNPACVPK